MKRTRTTVDDPGLDEIAAWHQWFLEAHRARLRQNGCDDSEVEDLMVPIVEQATHIVAKMREDYLIAQRRT